MRISIENFKSINSLVNFNLKPLTVFSGVNSAGKSSFIQFLLLLKQTIQLESSKEPFLLSGEYYVVGDFLDIISGKDPSQKLKFALSFDKSEFIVLDELRTLSAFNRLGDYTCQVEIEYEFDELRNKVFISSFGVKFLFSDGKEQFISVKLCEKGKYSIETNTGIFDNGLFINSFEIKNVIYSSIYPLYYEYEESIKGELGDEESVTLTRTNRGFFDLDDIKSIINSFIENISYLEPNRERPKESYSQSSTIKGVGLRGEHTAQILKENAQAPISYFQINQNEDGCGLNYTPVPEGTFISAVKYWMCDVFETAADIKSIKENDSYKIVLVNSLGLETNINHVGFGISQLLPIVVEGLRMSEQGTLIIEQPEIHLHPKLQGKLYDFLYMLILQGKKVIVETHSSHFITRMRRRIAEDMSNKMDDEIGLTFVEDNIFRTLNLDDYGTLDYYPENFIEHSHTENKAIIQAQIKKRQANDK